MEDLAFVILIIGLFYISAIYSINNQTKPKHTHKYIYNHNMSNKYYKTYMCECNNILPIANSNYCLGYDKKFILVNSFTIITAIETLVFYEDPLVFSGIEFIKIYDKDNKTIVSINGYELNESRILELANTEKIKTIYLDN